MKNPSFASVRTLLPVLLLLAPGSVDQMRVSVESPVGRPLPVFGRVSSIHVLQDLTPRQAELTVDTNPVQVLVESEDRVVWQGVVPPGKGFVPVYGWHIIKRIR